MSRRLGMAPDAVRTLAGSLQSQLASLDSVQVGIATAVATSLSPFSLIPGSLIFAPWSIAQAGAASLDIINAKASGYELVRKLLAEAAAQEFASMRADASYRTGWAPRTPDANRDQVIDLARLLEGPAKLLKGMADVLSDVASWAELAWLTVVNTAPKLVEKVASWRKSLPGWATKMAKIGRIIPILGTGVSAVDLGIAIYEGDWVQGIRHGGSIVIDGLTAILVPTGVGALIGAGVGVLWDLGWDAGENIYKMSQNPDATRKYVQENPWIAVPFVISPLLTLAFTEVVP